MLTSVQRRTWKCGQESRLIRWWSCWHTCFQPVVQRSAIVHSRPLLLPSYNNAFRHIWLSGIMGFEFFMHDTKKKTRQVLLHQYYTHETVVYIGSGIKLFLLYLKMGRCPTWWPPSRIYGGVLCESSVIPLLVPRHKVWLTAAVVPCSYAANAGERKTSTQSEFCRWQNSVTWKQPPKMYI